MSVATPSQNPPIEAKLNEEIKGSKAGIDFEYITTKEQLEKIVPILEASPIISIDTEGDSLDALTVNLLLTQIATEDKVFVIDMQQVSLEPIRHILEAPRPLKILQNAKYDYEVLKAQTGITLGNLYDTMLAERILMCGIGREISLKSLAEKYLGVTLDKTIRESFTENNLTLIRRKFTKEQLEYAAQDAKILIGIFQKQFKKLHEEALVDTAKLEFALVPVVGDMELKGSLIDQDKWRKHIEELQKKRNEINKEIQTELKHLTDYTAVDLFGNESDSINLDSPIQLVGTFKKLGVEIPNTSESTLQKVVHPIAKKLLEYRGFEKMITSFGESILEKIHPNDGRLHPDFMQLGADTGRFACNNPNLQQIPADSDFRSCFVAANGYKLITADYSQVELRIMAEVSQDPVFMNAFINDEDLHTLTASQMFRVPVEKVDKKMRFQAKSINFGLMYGRGPHSLAIQIGVTPEEATKLLEVYFATYKRVKRWLDDMGRKAIRESSVRTLGGRRRSFVRPDRDHPDYQRLMGAIERQGKNMPIQGTSADITKYALIYIAKEFKSRKLDASLIHTVHDEIVAEAKDEIAEEVKALMNEQMIRAGRKLLKEVPVKVEIMVSDCWSKG